MMQQWSPLLYAKKNSFRDSEFARSRGEKKKLFKLGVKHIH
jgi:hypothetical protein